MASFHMTVIVQRELGMAEIFIVGYPSCQISSDGCRTPCSVQACGKASRVHRVISNFGTTSMQLEMRVMRGLDHVDSSQESPSVRWIISSAKCAAQIVVTCAFRGVWLQLISAYLSSKCSRNRHNRKAAWPYFQQAGYLAWYLSTWTEELDCSLLVLKPATLRDLRQPQRPIVDSWNQAVDMWL
jgi:hypothetical protein